MYLPLGFGIGAGIGVGAGMMPKAGVKATLALGFFGFAGGLLLASYIHADSSYVGGVLLTLLLLERVTATLRNPLAEVPAEAVPESSSVHANP